MTAAVKRKALASSSSTQRSTETANDEAQNLIHFKIAMCGEMISVTERARERKRDKKDR